VRNIGLKGMTNDASGFPYRDNLQVLNDKRLGKRKKRLMWRFIISIIGKTVRNGAVKAIASNNY
jgi:hypothetical protein